MIQFLLGYQDVGFLIVRLALGLIFITHGYSKLKDLQKNAQGFEAMGFTPGVFWGTLVSIFEFFGGISVLFGLYTQWGALAIAAVMLIALIWKGSRGQGLIGGFELDLILLSSALLLSTSGAGLYSLDQYLTTLPIL